MIHRNNLFGTIYKKYVSLYVVTNKPYQHKHINIKAINPDSETLLYNKNKK